MHWGLIVALKTPRFGLLGVLSTAAILSVRPMFMTLPPIQSMFLMEIGVQWLATMAIVIMVSGNRLPELSPAPFGRRVAGLTYRVLMILSAAIPAGFRFGLRMQMGRQFPALRLTNRLRFMVRLI